MKESNVIVCNKIHEVTYDYLNSHKKIPIMKNNKLLFQQKKRNSLKLYYCSLNTTRDTKQKYTNYIKKGYTENDFNNVMSYCLNIKGKIKTYVAG